jgi:hypothetical protein
MFLLKKAWLALALGMGALTSAMAQSESVVLTQRDWADPVTITMTGEPTYFHRHRLEVEDVPAELQAIYQGSWSGELGMRVEGLEDGATYRVHLGYTEMDLNAPRRRVFDILINGEVVAEEVCIFDEVGNRRVLSFDFEAVAEGGVIDFFQRKTVPEADVPVFFIIQIYDVQGRLVGQKTAHELRPADWDLHGYLDKIYFGPIKDEHDLPPWEGSYKIRAHETDKLTAADVIGPDGIAYPNWTNVGLPDGIPSLPVTHDATDFGMIADDEFDDSVALQAAVDALGEQGGGVLFIPAGIYYLDRPVEIFGDNIVIRGAGKDRTRLLSRFTMTGRTPELHGIPTNGPLRPNNYIYAWVDPQGMTGVTLTLNGEPVKSASYPGLWETRILHRYTVGDLVAAAGAGEHELGVTVTYRDGLERATFAPVTLSESAVPGPRAIGVQGMIVFRGTGLMDDKIFLTRDGERGDMSLQLAPDHGLQAGDRIFIDGPTTDRWRQLTRNDHRGGSYRRNMYEITAVEDDVVRLPEALRLDFPTIDGSYVRRLQPQLHCGIEDLSLEHLNGSSVYSVVFEYNWESWVRSIEVVNTGNKALYMPNSKRCEVRDSVFDRAWNNSGGHAYIGWEHSYDCLMERVTAYDMRHAPCVQWATSGCVIRDSVFHNSDAQWHAGWTNESLFEGLIVESSQDGGSYGNGMWASGPEDTGHGPNGPRNVVYNCNITSSKAGMWMGGMNEAWLIVYNRFVVGRGPAILAKAASFDHIIQGNVFVTLEPYPGAIYLGSRDCTGIELVNNRFYGDVDQMVAGSVRPAVMHDNRVLASGDVNRPHPPVRSIYDWQQQHRDEIRATQQKRAQARGR